MKNKLITLSILLFSVSFAFAKPKQLAEPKKSEVILVGRISFSTDMDRTWLLDAVGVEEENRKYPDLYTLPFAAPDSVIKEKAGSKWATVTTVQDKDIASFSEQSWGINGDYFFVKYELGKDRTLYLSTATIFIAGSYLLPVLLPMNLKVTVPEGEKFLYLGDFSYSAKGFAFALSREVHDEYDAAQVALNSVTKKEYKLCRANPENITPEEIEKVQYYYTSPSTDLKKWYKMFKDVPLLEQ